MTYQDQFNAAYVAYRPPLFAPFYYGFNYGLAGSSEISPAARQALINQVITQGFSPVEQIESWCWDPFTVFADAALQGSSWLPCGQGNVAVVNIGQSGAVVPLGGYNGTAPANSTPVFTSLAQMIPWNTANPLPAVPLDPVGPLEYGPYYGVASGITNPPATYSDSRGTFVLTNVYQANVLGQPTIMKFYVLQ